MKEAVRGITYSASFFDGKNSSKILYFPLLFHMFLRKIAYTTEPYFMRIYYPWLRLTFIGNLIMKSL